MSNVVSIDKYKPHITGNAVCLTCNYQWIAVSEVGTIELQCPECSTYKGVYRGFTAPKIVFGCDCGCQHFYIGTKYLQCSMCGLIPDCD